MFNYQIRLRESKLIVGHTIKDALHYIILVKSIIFVSFKFNTR